MCIHNPMHRKFVWSSAEVWGPFKWFVFGYSSIIFRIALFPFDKWTPRQIMIEEMQTYSNFIISDILSDCINGILVKCWTIEIPDQRITFDNEVWFLYISETAQENTEWILMTNKSNYAQIMKTGMNILIIRFANQFGFSVTILLVTCICSSRCSPSTLNMFEKT